MKLKTRLLIIIMVVISGLAGVSGLSGWLLFKVHELKTAETLCGQTMDGVARLKRLTEQLLISETLDKSYAQWKNAHQSLEKRLESLNASPELQKLLKTESQQGMILSMNAFWQTTSRRLDLVEQNMALLLGQRSPSRDGLVYQYFDTKDYNILRIKNLVDQASLYLGSEFESKLSGFIEMVNREIDRQLKLTIQNIILVTLLISVTVCIILTAFLSGLNSHLQSWYKAMQILGRGGFPEKLPVTGDDELSRIAGAINQSSDNLAAIDEELRRRIDELHRAKQEAESANRAKGLFLAKMTHELKTPLNAIMGFSRLAAKSSHADAVQQKQITSISRNAGHLLALINEVLSMAKIEAGKEQLNEKPFDLQDLMAEMEQMFVPRARAKGIDMSFEGGSDAPRQIVADRVKLAQILINLIQNAINFTETGAVSVAVFTGGPESGSTPDFPMLGCSVTDTGCGIQTAEIKSIFEPFAQADTGRQSGRGTGLGLAVTGNYISMMNGTIDVDSTPGKGSCFRFFIPLKQAPQPGPQPRESGRKTAEPGLFTQPDLFSGPLSGQVYDRVPKDHGPDEGMDENEMASRLACVPAEIVEEMEKAAFFAEIDRLMTAIEGVKDCDAKLAAVLADAADAFDYNRILDMLRCSSHPTSYSDAVL